MFSILVYSLELNLLKFLWKKIVIFALNAKQEKYRMQLIRPFIKEKQQML